MTYTISLPNTLYGHLMPMEDALGFADKVFIVADGVTRDLSLDMNFKNKSIESIFENYPSPSGAKIAADTAVAVFLEKIQSGCSVRQGLVAANDAVRELNEAYNPNSDFLTNDFYACVASGGSISKGVLQWVVIGDCGVVVYSQNGEIKFATPNSFAVFERFVQEGKISFKWEEPEGRRYVRQEFRNRPDQIIDGTCAAYGALTGEGGAEPFIFAGQQSLEEGDLVVCYSDGFEPVLRDPKFFAALNQSTGEKVDRALRKFDTEMTTVDPKRFGKERSLLALS